MTDTFRKTYKELTADQIMAMDTIKNQAELIEGEIIGGTTPENGREMALAKTKLEECIMWAVKAITK